MIPNNILMWGIRILATMATLLGVGYVLNNQLDNAGVWQFISVSAICLVIVIFIFDICIVNPLMCRIKAGKSTIFRDCPKEEPNYAPETKPELPKSTTLRKKSTATLRKKSNTNSKRRKPIKRK